MGSRPANRWPAAKSGVHHVAGRQPGAAAPQIAESGNLNQQDPAEKRRMPSQQKGPLQAGTRAVYRAAGAGKSAR